MSEGSHTVRRVAIVGAGLVGGSIALAARAARVEEVVLTDTSPRVRERAADLGLADRIVDDPHEAAAGADLLVAAVPSASVADVLATFGPTTPPHAILTDAASLKLDLTLDVESRLKVEGGFELARRFVGGHPMAGSERSGPDAADAALFHGATWILTPTATTDDVALSTLSAFVRTLGARVVALSPQRHDELVAIVSHLPQVAASALASVAADAADEAGEVVLGVAGGGFRDTTRIAASDPDLWVGILTGNRAAVLEALDALRDRLDDARTALAAQDEQALRALLTRASTARRRMVPKVGERDLVDLVVALQDRPGALATATTALGEAGVNVEDVAMRHASDGSGGALVLRVAATATDQAVQVLAARELHAHVEPVVSDEPT